MDAMIQIQENECICLWYSYGCVFSFHCSLCRWQTVTRMWYPWMETVKSASSRYCWRWRDWLGAGTAQERYVDQRSWTLWIKDHGHLCVFGQNTIRTHTTVHLNSVCELAVNSIKRERGNISILDEFTHTHVHTHTHTHQSRFSCATIAQQNCCIFHPSVCARPCSITIRKSDLHFPFSWLVHR